MESTDYKFTPDGTPRGYIQPHMLRELWFHTGTICNLECPFCLEGSKPGDDRVQQLTFEETTPFIDEALTLDVEQFSFTGGEPFVVKDFIRILDYALDFRPCHVLTNGTEPLIKRFDEVLSLKAKPNALTFRISLDYPDADKHDAGRGKGNFLKSLKSIAMLQQHGFRVSIARQQENGETTEEVKIAFNKHLESVNANGDVSIITFPDLLIPFSSADVPAITENCMTTYKDEKSRSEFMCSYSKMIVKQNGKLGVYACTLVDDDPNYNLGSTLTEAMNARVMLKHHRCFACFSQGTSCSE